jgi:hypothetical protein
MKLLLKGLKVSGLLVLLQVILTVVAFGGEASRPIDGHVDVVNIDNKTISLQGWTAVQDGSDSIQRITVSLGDVKLFDDPIPAESRVARPDVATVMGRSDWESSGWMLKIKIPSGISGGEHTISVEATSEHGHHAEILITPGLEKVRYNQRPLISKLKNPILILSVIGALSLSVYIFIATSSIARKVYSITGLHLREETLFGSYLVLVFICMLIGGITGSSYGIGVKQTPYMKSDMRLIWGNEQPIRSDEWLVLTPNALAQVNHVPPFPVVNSNLGDDGQNMLVVGMTGVPVLHISALAKPATWGFFVFDIKRALAWHWLFPIFSCLLALWAVSCSLSPGSWRTNFLLALCFTSSAYSVAWSNWPDYVVFFPCAIFLCFTSILKAERTSKRIALALPMGIAISGFALVLYPPWQIPLAYLFLAIAVGTLFRDSLYKKLTYSAVASYGIALVIAAALLASWWLSAADAIQAMQNTIYPGQRTTVTGGEVTLDFLLKGFTNLTSLAKLDSPFSNQSEIASFYYLLLPLLTALIIKIGYRKATSLDFCIALFIAFTLYFMFYGVSSTIAQFSLWGRVTPKRADLALGLACLLLSGLMASRARQTSNNILIQAAPLIAAVIWTISTIVSVSKLNPSITAGFTTGAQIIVYTSTLVAGYSLAAGKIRSYLIVLLGLTAGTTYSFNPVIISPTYISANIPKANTTSTDRVLSVDSVVPSMLLLSTGVKTVNGVFYYPQTTVWNQLDSQHSLKNIYNRYQHLDFHLDKEGSVENFSLLNPALDRVEVRFNGREFDFSSTSATKVIAPPGDEALKDNESLRFLGAEAGWMWFEVKR